jgi:hypothetical protein
MGIFKDLHTVSKQGKALGAQSDVGDRLQKGMESMAQANQYLVEQAAGAQLATTGTPARLQVTGARDSGTVVNMQPVLELSLLVQPVGGVPYPATVRQTVPAASTGRVVPGSVLSGRVDPTEPTAVWIDWTA